MYDPARAPRGRGRGLLIKVKRLREIIGEQKLRYLLLLVVNTVLFFAVYRIFISYGELTGETFYAFVTLIVYFALLLGFTIAYLVYNRFFYRQGVTKEQLPLAWSEEEKEEFLCDAAARIQKSKWMLTVIFPLLFTFLIDSFQLFILERVF